MVQKGFLKSFLETVLFLKPIIKNSLIALGYIP